MGSVSDFQEKVGNNGLQIIKHVLILCIMLHTQHWPSHNCINFSLEFIEILMILF
jgi:hypothetical protein